LENYWNYKNESDFSYRLEEFNKRRKIFLEGGFNFYLQNKYKTAYRRFIDKANEIFKFLEKSKNFLGFSIKQIFSEEDINLLRQFKLIKI